ncbi:lysosomal-trafficking regulator-like [Littorina saxatilis]|uniref:lysosomal-trafficking regulator-like n=1 Tax=Littorina saxatilis TaxID=31220 RepID=UPI0038B4F67B
MLSETWETYAQLSRRLPEKDTSSNVKKKQVILDRFLCQFLKESSTDENCILSEMRNVPNELSHEFMRNIFTVTSSTAEGDDITNLENYLLEDHGWMLLYAIHKIGVQGVYNRHDLCNILLTLLPFCLKIRLSDSNGYHLNSLGTIHTSFFVIILLFYILSCVEPQVPVSRCFQWVDHLPKHTRHVSYDFKGYTTPKKSSSSPSHREKKRYTKTVSSKEKDENNESEAEDSDVRRPRQPRLKKSMRTQVWTPLLKEEESGSEDESVDSREGGDVESKSIGSSHLFQLLLHLLEDLAVLDVSLSNPGQTLSSNILPVLLDVLLSFSAASSSGQPQDAASQDVVSLPWPRETGLVLHQQLLRVILTLSGIIATQQNGVRILLSLKVVPGVLSSLAYCDRNRDHSNGDNGSKQQSLLEWNVIQDAVCGCLDLFRVVYNNLPFNPSFVRDANAVMELFRRHGGEDYFRYLYVLSDKQNRKKDTTIDDGQTDPIKWLCNLIHCLKVVKVNYIHAIKCLKRRHRNCEYGIFFHHHHDIFGAPLETVLVPPSVNEESSVVQMKLADPSLCQMAKWSCLLLECLRKAQAKSTKLLILSALREEGVCCCLLPATVVNTIVPLVPALSPAVRNYALETLNVMLLSQFQGSAEAQGVTGVGCSQCSSDRQVLSDTAFRIDSGFASCEVGETREQKTVSRWRSLRLLCQHILSGDESIALVVAKQLITLAIGGNSDIKEELFFGIYLHVLNMRAVEQPANAPRGEKEELTSSGEEGNWVSTVPNSVMLFCVSSLPYVLQVDKVMWLFLEKSGLMRLTQLLDNEQLRVPVMGVFEALIMIDEQQMITRHAPASTLTAQQSMEYKGGIVIQTFIDTLAQKTCAITAAFQQLQLKSQKKNIDMSPKNKENVAPEGIPPADSTASEDEDGSVDDIHKSILETLPALLDMWKTCAKLCMNSETFRACYRNSPCLYIVQETLVLAMGILVDLPPTSACETSSDDQVCGKEVHDGCSKQSSSLAILFSRLAFIEAVMIVCFSCEKMHPLQKEGEEEEMWLRVRSTLAQCVELEPSKLRAVFDMLLNAAQPQLPSILEYSYAQITSTLCQQDMEDVEGEDEVKMLVHHWSDEEFETFHTEQGYEADTETNQHDDWHESKGLKKGGSTCLNVLVCVCLCVGIEGSLLRHGVKQTTVQCFPAVLRLFVELLVASQNSASGQTVMVPVMLRLLHMLRSSHTTATAACKQGLLELMLKGFQHVLLQPAHQQQLLYEILLTTVQVLGQVEISSSELGLLFSFFLHTKDMDSLLSTLTGIAENSWVAPSTYLTFPAKGRSIRVKPDHPSQDLTSAGVWGVSAIQCAVKGLQWPPFETGFSLSLWFSLDLPSSTTIAGPPSSEKSQDRESAPFTPVVQDCVHLVSLGDSTKMFEVWLHVASTTLLFRLSSLKSGSLVLKETAVGLSLSSLDWHNVGFSYLDSLDGSTSLGKLSVRVDRHLEKEVVMDHPASMWHCPVSNATPSLHLGHTAGLKDRQRLGQFNLGPVLLFSDSSLSHEWWFHLFALGPTVAGLGRCDCGFPQVSYAGLLHRAVLRDSLLNHDVLAGSAPVPDMEKALMTQVLYFDPENWRSYCRFGQPTERNNASLLGLVPSASTSQALLGQRPLECSSSVSGEMRLMKHVNLPQALEQLGGVQALLFLVAKVVEESGHLKKGGGVKELGVQSKAVHLLLTLLHRFPPLSVTFTHMQGYEMMAVVLRSSRAHVSHSLVKVLFDAATTESVFKVDGLTGRLLLRSGSESVICNIAIVTHLLLCWHVWQQAEHSLMELILSALVVLVRTDHPHQAFNVRQLQAAGVVKLLFNMYLERIQEDMPALSGVCGRHVAAIVASVVGSPPDLALLASITDFLLQLHPPTTRFINYTPSAFYLHPLWLSGEEPVAGTTKVPSRKGGNNKGEKVKQVASPFSTSDQDTEMEVVQFHSQQDISSETCWDSMEGSENTENELAIDEVNRPASSPHYPLLEATTDTPTRSFCLQGSSESSDGFTQSGIVTSDVADIINENNQAAVQTSESVDLSTQTSGNQQIMRQNSKNKSNRSSTSTQRSLVLESSRLEQTSSPRGVGTEDEEPWSDSVEKIQEAFADAGLSSGEDSESDKSSLSSEGRHGAVGNSVEQDSTDQEDVRDSTTLSDSSQQVRASLTEQVEEASRSSSPSSVTHERPGTPGDQEGLETLCLCVLQYVCKVVMEQPQHSMDEVFCQVINPRALLVLAQSSSAHIRVAITQVVSAYLWRAPVEMLDEFLKEDGLFLLANQLSAFPVCQSQVEAAFSLMLQHSFTFHDHYRVGELGQVNELQQVAPVLVLSMLCRILPDIALSHNTLGVIAQVVEHTPVMSSILLDLGLPDALCNLLYTAQCFHSSATDVEGIDSIQLLLLDVQNIFCLLAVAHFSWSGVVHFQQVEYLFSLLQAMEDKEHSRGESGTKRAETARALQYAMVVSVLEYVQQLSQEMGRATGSWQSSSSSATGKKVTGVHRSFEDLSEICTTRSRTLSFSLLTSSSSSPHPSVTPTLPGVGVAKSSSLRSTHSSPHMYPLLNADQHVLPTEQKDRLFEDIGQRGMSRATSHDEGKQSLLQRLFGRKKKLEYVRITQSDLLERFKKFLVLAVDLAVFQERREKEKPQTQHTLSFLPEPSTASLDDRFLKHMFTTVYQALALSLTKDPFFKRTRNTIMLSAKDVLRVQFGRLLTCMVSPRMEFDQRIFTVSFLMGESVGRDVVRQAVVPQHVCTELGIHLHDLLSVWRDWLNPNQRDLALTLLTLLRQCGCTVTSPDRSGTPEQAEALQEDKRSVEIRLIREQQAWRSKRAAYPERVESRFEELVSRVQNHAIALTRQMAAQQARERSSLVEHIKHTIAQQVQLKKNWQELVHSLTHERGVWHHAESYPQSWELDPTEGPSRIRRRLMRCHLGLQPKYICEPYRQKLVQQEKPPPLKYLFEDDHQVADSATLVYKLYTSDTVHNTFVCTSVSPATESRGELLLGEQYVYFVADKAISDTDYTQMLLGNRDQMSQMWRYSELSEVHTRWFQLLDIGLEMFVITGRTYLLAFTSTADRDRVATLLLGQLDRPKGPEQTAANIQRQWIEGSLTNFDYLTQLNKLAGRSFNDLMQYPVFPFVLRDYDSEELDLENSGSFRDLRKPIAVQDKSRERKYMDNYEFLRQENQKPGPEEVMRVEPFHYGSHYSNSGTVLHYLVRLFPFTRMFLAYQDRSFDIPDRTFHNIRTSWRLSSFESSTDVKELIPEFFYLPEFLVNSEGFNFGYRQNGEVVNDVVLPPWCNGDPRLFVLIQRQGLESAVATRMLHHWLDLVFGFKQTGEEAVKAINVFHPSTYFGMDVSSVTDPVKRQALLTMIRTYGQTPRQLFVNPHPAADPTHAGLTAPAQQLDKRTYVPRPVKTVNGLRWGRYVGSLEMPKPLWQRVTHLPVPIASMVPLVTGLVCGIQSHSTLIMLHNKPAGTSYKQTEVLWAGAVTWDQPDGILRVFIHNSKPLINLMPPNPYDKVTCCAAALDRCLLFVACASGNISVFNMTHNVAKPSMLHVWGLRRMLCGHHGPVSVLQVCKEFGIVVSAGQDCSAVIWDINRLSYVRTVTKHKAPVVAVAVSSTLGDVATVSHVDGPQAAKMSSVLQVHTINGREVGSYTCTAHITCLAYSSAPEGRSINVIAGGLSTGVVRLWSSWDVSHLRDLSDDVSIARPILSLAYTTNSQALFVSLSDGTIGMWHSDQHSSSANAALFMPVLPHGSN